jgi:hypothetical protein
MVLVEPTPNWFLGIAWGPLIDALQRLHLELSPGARKTFRVLIVGPDDYDRGIQQLKERLLRMRTFAEVEICSVPFSSHIADTPIAEFPLATHPSALWSCERCNSQCYQLLNAPPELSES